jgi:HEAT repeat protein
MLIGSQFEKTNNGGEQVAELQQEMKSMKEMLILSKLQQPVASERIVAASYLEQVSAPDKDVLNALIQTMNTDKNSNVRMAAMNALTKFRNEQLVADALVESLASQTDPIIQISLINILVEMQDTRAVDKMKQIIEDNSTNESVKKLAEEGILTLI